MFVINLSTSTHSSGLVCFPKGGMGEDFVFPWWVVFVVFLRPGLFHKVNLLPCTKKSELCTQQNSNVFWIQYIDLHAHTAQFYFMFPLRLVCLTAKRSQFLKNLCNSRQKESWIHMNDDHILCNLKRAHT